MSGGTTFDTELASTTIDRYISLQVKDQVFDEHTLLGWIERKVGIDRISGGHNVLITVGTAEDTTGGSYSGYDTFDTTPSEALTNAVSGWKSYQQPITASYDEIARNSSPEGKIKIWKVRSDRALKSLRSKLNAHAHAASVGNSGKNIQGIGLLVDSAGTVQNIDRSTSTYWQANETAVSAALAIDGSTGMRRMHTLCSTGSGDMSVPDGIMTDSDEYEAYEALLAPDIRFTSRTQGDGSFSGLAYRGAPIMWDADNVSGVMYFLNSETFEFYIDPERDFVTTEIARAMNGTLNQDAWSAQILWRGELVINEPRRNGKLTGLTD